MLETALCFMVVASITALIYTEGFKKISTSILFGVFLGLGLLTKQYYIVFIIGPLLFLILLSFFSSDIPMRKKIIMNLSLSSLMGVSIASWWYIPNLSKILHGLIFSAFNPNAIPPHSPHSVYSTQSPLFYFFVLVNQQILLFFFLVFISALIITFWKRKNRFFFLFLIWIIYPYFIFSLFNNKFWYYTIAYLPAVAYISAYGIMNIQKEFLRRTVILLISVISLFQFFLVSYVHYRGIKIRVMHIKVLPWPMADILAGVKYYPERGNWKVNAMIARILKESHGEVPVIGAYEINPNVEQRVNSDQAVFICRLNSYAGAHFDSLNYHLRLKNIRYKLIVLNKLWNKKIVDRINFIVTPLVLKNISDFGIIIAPVQ